LRFKLFLVLASLLILAVVGLPLIIKTDGSAQGFTQIILTYTLSTITALLGLSTLWLSCGTLARDIEECQVQVVAVKPVARWRIWLGKWLGILSLNAVLLALSGACVFGLLQWRAAQLAPDVQKTLREQILVARGSAKEASHADEIEALTARILQDKVKSAEVKSPEDVVLLRNQIREELKADSQLVPPSYRRTWKIDLGLAKNSLHGKPLQVRIKFNTPKLTPGLTYDALWQIGDPPNTHYWRTNTISLAQDTFYEFAIPPDLYDADGILTIQLINPNDTPLLFAPEDGLEVLYPAGGFALNFARGLGIILCWMALLAALGLAAASELSFPVAAFFALAMMLVVFSSGTLADAVASGTVAGGNAETGAMNHTFADVVLIPAFKCVLTVVSLAKNFSPIDALSTGRSITWGELGTAFAQIVLLLGGIFAVAGITFFSRRELATAQGTQ